MPLLKLDSISKIYGRGDAQVKALDNINFTVEAGEMLAVMGASGSGKSTLLNIVGCIDKPTHGTYLFKGNDVTSFSPKEIAHIRNEEFGFVIQNFALVDDYTVFQNVMIPLNYSHKANKKNRSLIIDILKKLNIQSKVNEKAYNLSGGQRQRVAIARAIVNKPSVVLADEPTGALDTVTSQKIMDLFKNLNSQGLTIIIVTHNEKIADYCKRKIIIQDGKIIKDN